MAVRKIAQREGIGLSGSIGILLELIGNGDISLERGNAVLREFIRFGYYSPLDRLDGLLRL